MALCGVVVALGILLMHGLPGPTPSAALAARAVRLDAPVGNVETKAAGDVLQAKRPSSDADGICSAALAGGASLVSPQLMSSRPARDGSGALRTAVTVVLDNRRGALCVMRD